MRVFLSWSGATSRQIAEILYSWIPKVLQAIEPFLSSQDIEKGERWLSSISTNLENIDVGIVVVTKANITAPWINFEAGALSKKIDRSRIIPVLFGITDTDLVNHPLAQFQYVKLERDDLLRLFRMLNLSCPKPLSEAQFEETFSLWFEKHFEMLQKVKPSDADKKPKEAPSSQQESDVRFRRMEAAIDEILNYQRRMRHSAPWAEPITLGGGDKLSDRVLLRLSAKEPLRPSQVDQIYRVMNENFKRIDVLDMGSEGITVKIPRGLKGIENLKAFLEKLDGMPELTYEVRVD